MRRKKERERKEGSKKEKRKKKKLEIAKGTFISTLKRTSTVSHIILYLINIYNR